MFTTLIVAPSVIAFWIDNGLFGGVKPRGGARHGVGELDLAPVRRGPGFGLRDRLVAPVDASGIGQRVRLDVQIDTWDVIGGDHLLVDPGYRRDAGATVGDIGAGGVRGVTAERGDDVAARRLDHGDVAAEAGRGDGLAGVTVPVRRARA